MHAPSFAAVWTRKRGSPQCCHPTPSCPRPIDLALAKHARDNVTFVMAAYTSPTEGSVELLHLGRLQVE